MDATINSEIVYTITLGGKEYPGFRTESRWEGFVKLSDGKHIVIAKEVPNLSFSFFGPDGGRELTIISCSPGMLAPGGGLE